MVVLLKKTLFPALAACICCAVVLTAVLAAAVEHDHDCNGENCPVCLQIESAKNFLKILKLAGVGLLAAVCSVSPAQIHKKYTEFTPYLLSPVSLKVRFNS